MTKLRADIKAIRRDHTRALVHAETPDGLDLKLEVPLTEVEGLTSGTLVISYELERAPQPDASAELHQLLAPYLPKPTVAAAEAPQTAEARLARLLGLTTGTTTP